MPMPTTRSKTPNRQTRVDAILAQNAKFGPHRSTRASRPAPRPAPRVPSAAQIDARAKTEAARQNAALEKLHKVKYYTSGADAAHERAKAQNAAAERGRSADVRAAADGDKIAIACLRQSLWYWGPRGTDAQIQAGARELLHHFQPFSDEPADVRDAAAAQLARIQPHRATPARRAPSKTRDIAASWRAAVAAVNRRGQYAQQSKRGAR